MRQKTDLDFKHVGAGGGGGGGGEGGRKNEQKKEEEKSVLTQHKRAQRICMRSSRDDQRYWRINRCGVVAVDTPPNTSVSVTVSVRLCRLPEAAARQVCIQEEEEEDDDDDDDDYDEDEDCIDNDEK